MADEPLFDVPLTPTTDEEFAALPILDLDKFAERGNEPLFDCDDPECADGCTLTEFPTWMRPYRCRHVDALGRRVRRIVFGEPGDPIA